MLGSKWFIQSASPGVSKQYNRVGVDDSSRPSNSKFENPTSKGEATWFDSPQPRLRSRGQRLRQVTDMPRPQAALGNPRRRAPRSSPIATGGRSGSFPGGGDDRLGSYATPTNAFAAADRSSSAVCSLGKARRCGRRG